MQPRRLLGALVLSVAAIACDRSATDVPRPASLVAGTPKVASLLTVGDANPFGINTYLSVENEFRENFTTGRALLDTLSQNNIGWSRMGISWIDVETHYAGEDSYRSLERLLWGLREIYNSNRQMRAYVQIHFYAPDWARNYTGMPNNGPACDKFPDWRNFVQRVVDSAYAIGVRHFSIHNEPGDSGATGKEYLAQFRPFGAFACSGSGWVVNYEALAYEAAKAIHSKPGAKMIYWESGGGDGVHDDVLIPVAQESITRLANRAATEGYAEPVDIIGIHNYSKPKPWETFAQAAVQGTVREMNAWAAQTNKELWLTEYGTTEFGTIKQNGEPVGERDQRDFHASLVRSYILAHPARWTRLFAFDDEDEHRFTQGVRHDIPFTTTEAFWAYGFLARRYGGDVGVSYRTYLYDNGVWYSGQDGQITPSWYSGSSTSPGLWGAQINLNQTLVRAGVRACGQYHLAYIGWIGWYCDGNTMGPIEFGGQPHDIEAFKLKLEGALPGYSLCGQAKPRGQGWGASSCGAGAESGQIGTTGQGLPLQQLKLWLGGDVR